MSRAAQLMPKRKLGLTLKERLERYVLPEPNSGCHLWVGNTDSSGYGTIGTGGASGKVWKTHRVSWTVNVGPIPEGLHVLHRCDTPLCVNPDHLFLGTNSDNVRDKIQKGRHGFVCGSDQWQAKLTEDAVRHIRTSDISNDDAAELYGVNRTTVCAARRRKTWKHVQ